MSNRVPREEIQALSNERLEDSIAAYYWEMYQAGKWQVTPRSRVLDALWEEFDERMENGDLI